MGELINMPLSNMDFENETDNAIPSCAAENDRNLNIDFSAWKNAPRERTSAYFPTYSAVSKAIQSALRAWVHEWLTNNVEILKRPTAAHSILVYQCTHPYSGKPTNIFTYEIQERETLNRAFRSAANKMSRQLKSLDTKRLPWFTREHYFAYRSKEVVKYVFKNPRAIYRMLHVETLLMNAILRFSIMDIPELGVEESLVRLRRTFRTQLRRFSEHFDLSPRTEELLQIATNALVDKMAVDAAVDLTKVA
jgi:hypothetical protein